MPHRQRNKYKLTKKKLKEGMERLHKEYVVLPVTRYRSAWYEFEISGTSSTATIGGFSHATSSTTSTNI